MKTIHERALAYIGLIHSISGSNGHESCLKAATALIKKFGLPEDEAFELFQIWNTTNASPPWPIADLKHKISEAAKSTRPAGFLLANESRFTPRTHAPRLQPPVAPETTPEQKRLLWPTFHTGSDAELRAVAALRNVAAGVVWTAYKLGMIRFGEHYGQPCFFLIEGTIGQARKMEGQPFEFHGEKVKALNLPGSKGYWFGTELLKKRPKAPVLITEGMVGWLEAAEWISTHKDGLAFIPLAAVSAAVKIDAEILKLLCGRPRIIIAHDSDTTGVQAGIRWRKTLSTSGVQTTLWTMPKQFDPTISPFNNQQ